MLFRGKTGSRAEFFETSDNMDQRTPQQCSQRQVIDTSRVVDPSLMNIFRQPCKKSEGLGIGSRCSVSRKWSFIKDLFG